MKVLNVNNHIFDVFTFSGWENWSRWNKDRRGFLTQIGGEPVTGFMKSIIIKKLTEK